MLPKFLLPECITRADGVGPKVELGAASGKLLVLTLGINRIVEQERLIVSIWGSPNGVDWGIKPLATFPPKFYCGMYSILLNLAKNPDARCIRSEWKMSRWGKGDQVPLFGFYVCAEESGSRLSTAVASVAAHAAIAC
jgi:hypothetical protein